MNTNKLKLQDLQIESFATQVSEKEMMNLKGGTAWWCALVLVIVTAIINYVMESGEAEAGIDYDNGDIQIDLEIGAGVSIDSVTVNQNGTYNFYGINQ